MYELYLFVKDFYNFFLHIHFLKYMWSTNSIYTAAWKSEKTFWRGSKRNQRNHRHNAQYYYSKRSSSESPVRKSVARSHLALTRKRYSICIMRSRNWRTKIRVWIPLRGHWDLFSWTLNGKSFSSDLITINIWPAGWQPFFP